LNVLINQFTTALVSDITYMMASAYHNAYQSHIQAKANVLIALHLALHANHSLCALPA